MFHYLCQGQINQLPENVKYLRFSLSFCGSLFHKLSLHQLRNYLGLTVILGPKHPALAYSQILRSQMFGAGVKSIELKKYICTFDPHCGTYSSKGNRPGCNDDIPSYEVSLSNKEADVDNHFILIP